MFKKKSCKNCKGRIKERYEFCPYCGMSLKGKQKDFGMLGKNDAPVQMPNMMAGGLNSGMLNKMIGGAMKMLEKEMSKDVKNQPRTKFKLMINGKEVVPQGITPQNMQLQKPTDPSKTLPIEFSKENQEKFTKLKKHQPKTNLKRFGDKLIYELEIPGVNTIKDISILKLEKGIEIRAIAKNKAYHKTIMIDLPLTKYILLKGKLTLELKTE